MVHGGLVGMQERGVVKSGVSADAVVARIEMILGWTPDQNLIDYHLSLGFKDRAALGAYMMSTHEFRSKMGLNRRQPIFLGDRVMAFTHRGETIYLVPNDLDLTPHILEHGMHEPGVERLIIRSLKAGDVAVDVGCNVGYHTMAIARTVGPTGKVYAFEANPAIIPLLKSSLEINGFTTFRSVGLVDLHWSAISDKPGKIVLEAAPGHSGSGHVVNDTPTSDMGREYSVRSEVAAVKLDDVLAHVPYIDFLHMDIEGAEPLAIMGGIELIKRSPNLIIVSEWSVNMMNTLTNVDGFIALMVENGFRFWRHDGGGGVIAETPQSLTSLPHCDLFISRSDPAFN